MDDVVLTDEQLCQWLRIGHVQLKIMMRKGMLPTPWLVCGNRRWKKAEVDHHLNRTCRPQPEAYRKVHPNDVPTCLADLAPLLGEYKWPDDLDSLYFLFCRGEIIYIGITNHLPRRVEQHRKGDKKNPPKVFDRVFFILDTPGKVAFWERYYVGLLKPKYNDAMTGRTRRTRKPSTEP